MLFYACCFFYAHCVRITGHDEWSIWSFLGAYGAFQGHMEHDLGLFGIGGEETVDILDIIKGIVEIELKIRTFAEHLLYGLR